MIGQAVTTKNAKTILFAFLIAAMAVPFSSRAPAVAQTDSDSTGENAYVREIKAQEAYGQMDDEKQQELIEGVRAQMKQDPYNIKVYEILNKFSEIKAQIAAAEKNGEDTTKLTQDAWAIVFELGEYGVVTEERLLQNKEYWQNKAQEAIKRLRDGETQSASYRPANNDIVQVHTDDVSLKVQAEIE